MMEQEPKEIADRQIYETSIGPVCMSKRMELTIYENSNYLCISTSWKYKENY